jgi:hypothetical protein
VVTHSFMQVALTVHPGRHGPARPR